MDRVLVFETKNFGSSPNMPTKFCLCSSMVRTGIL